MAFFYWVILLWRHLSRPESILLLALALLLVVSPLLLNGQFDRVRTEWSAPMRVVRNLEDGRLYSGLFRDLEDLRLALPENVAVRQLAADLHLSLGQVEYARSMNEDLVTRNPRNAVAHNNLGGYYKDRREFGKAIEHFRESSRFEAGRPEPLYNLYQVYRDNLAIDEAVVELKKARQLDQELVNSWHEEDLAWVGMRVAGGELTRAVRTAVRQADRLQSGQESTLGPATNPSVLGSFLACLGVGLLVAFLVGPGGDVSSRSSSGLGRGEKALRLLVPGLSSAWSGEGLHAFAVLVPFVSPLVLLRGPEIGYKTPWGVQPSKFLLWALVVVVWASLYAVRWRLDSLTRSRLGRALGD